MPHTRQPYLRLIAGSLGFLLIVLLACEWLGWPFLRAPLATRASAQLNRDVRLEGQFRLHLLGAVRVRVERLTVATTPWESSRSGERAFILANGVRLDLPYRSLLGRTRGTGQEFLIRRLEVDRIAARLVRLADGRRNWRFESPPEGRDARSASSLTPVFEHLVVHEGRLSLDDAVASLALEATVRTDEGTANGSRGLRVTAHGHYRDLPFTASAAADGLLPLVAPRGRTGAVALRFDAHLADPGRADSFLRFDGSAQDLLRAEGLQGQFSVQGPSLAAVGAPLGVTLPTTAPFAMEGRLRKSGDRWDVDVSRFSVARTRLAGRFRYDTAARPPRLTGGLRGEQLVLEDLAPAVGASPATARSDRKAPDAPARERILPGREFDIPSLHRMNARVEVALDRVDLGSERLRALAPLKGTLTLQDGVLTLDQLLARTADGELAGRVVLDGRPEIPAWRTELRWSGIRLAQWITARNRFADEDERVRAANGHRVDPPFITGELAGQANLAGRGRSTAGMLSSLDGTLQLWVRGGELSQLVVEAIGLDVAQGLGLVVKGDRNIPMQCAALSLKARDGTLATEAGIVDTPDSLILVRGTVSLAQERLDLTLEARPHDRSPLSVRAPIHVRGRFADPRVRPDMGKVGGKTMLATLLGSLLAPFAALLPLVDPGEDRKGQGCAATLARLEQNPDTPAAMKRAVGGAGATK